MARRTAKKKAGRPRRRSSQPDAESLLNIEQVARRLNIPERHVRRLIHALELHAVDVGPNTTRVDPRALEKFIETHDHPYPYPNKTERKKKS